MISRANIGRTTAALVISLCLVYVALAPAVGALEASPERTVTERPASLDGNVVITTQKGDLLVYDADEQLVFDTHERDTYLDVDPVPNTTATVEYVATDRVRGPECMDRDWCYHVVVERLNLSTNETELVYDWYELDFEKQVGRPHDVDRTGPHRLLFAGTTDDRVYEVDTQAGIITWGWRVIDHYPTTTGSGVWGGLEWGDWSHVNDVEVINESVVMVSVRDHDAVVFVHRERGVLEGMTLGADDHHDVLYEQHNPDYIPAERGGPAVLVADSQNNRVIEYRRADGEWVASWTYGGLRWPRDADRLPDGSTLITDTNANRVIVVDDSGAVTWSVRANTPYEAEMLGTGDESAGGPARGGVARGAVDPVAPPVASSQATRVSAKLINAIAFVLPAWASPSHALAAGLAALLGVTWLSFEFVHRRRGGRA